MASKATVSGVGPTDIDRKVYGTEVDKFHTRLLRVSLALEESREYWEFRDEFGPELCKGDRDGYGFLLGLLYDELAVELPGVFGRVGITELAV